MSEEEIKCLNNCGFANVTQLLLAYVSLQQENSQLKEQVQCLIKQRDDTNKSAVETIEKFQQGNSQLKEKIEKAQKLIEVSTYPENIYLGFCYLFGKYDYDELPSKIKEALK